MKTLPVMYLQLELSAVNDLKIIGGVQSQAQRVANQFMLFLPAFLSPYKAIKQRRAT